jgi:class 3 adenylate cyclase
MTATRRLAAILAADVAGYSRLIGADESGTLQALKAIRAELIDPTIAAHNGRLVKTTGDGLLVEFGSVVDALRCATEVQAGMAERNATAPAGKRVEFRIGINMGDVVVEDGDAGKGEEGSRQQSAGPSLTAVCPTLSKYLIYNVYSDQPLRPPRCVGN